MENNEQPILTRAEKRARKRAAKAEAAKSQKNNSIAQVVGAVLLVAALIVGWQAISKNGSSDTYSPPAVGEITDKDYIKGNIAANVVLTEYSDFQCPACAGYAPILRQVADEYGDRIAFVYRHYPLFSIHPNAEEAAWAAEAAGKQGQFWEMHDLLFERQQQWSSERRIKSTLFDYAESLGLEMTQFESDYESDDVRDKVAADVVSGNRERVSGTPTFFINGSKMTSARSIDDFRRIIDMELEVSNHNNSGVQVSDDDISVEVEDNNLIQIESVTTGSDG